MPLRADVAVEVPALVPTPAGGEQRPQHLRDEPVPLPTRDVRPGEVVDVHHHRARQRCGDPRPPAWSCRTHPKPSTPDPAGAVTVRQALRPHSRRPRSPRTRIRTTAPPVPAARRLATSPYGSRTCLTDSEERHVSTPVKVAVTGAAGQIGYSLLFRIASGAMLGPDPPVELRLLEITPALQGARGRGDGARRLRLPALAGVEIGDDPNTVFDGVSVALPGRRPARAPRAWSAATCSRPTAAIFKPQGKALNDHAADDVKVLVTGNPANTNALIAMQQRAGHPAERFNALTRLDHNRAIAQLAAKTDASVNDITPHDDLGQPLCHPVPGPVQRPGRRTQRRGAGRRPGLAGVRPSCRPCSSEARRSSRPAGQFGGERRPTPTVDHMRDWVLGTPEGDWVSMAVPSDGSYGVPEGLISSFPCTVPRRRVPDRAGPGDQRLLPQQDRQHGG